MVPWRNWLARSTVNREVAGSSPAGTEFFFITFRIDSGVINSDRIIFFGLYVEIFFDFKSASYRLYGRVVKAMDC